MVFSAFSIIFNDVKKCDNRFYPEMQCRGFLGNGSFLVAIYLEIVISSHFRGGNRSIPIGNLWRFAQIFHGHFCQLAENHGFLKSWSKKGRALL